jgi:hypothetical protein
MPAGCRIPSYPPLIAPPSHRRCPVAPAGCCITSRRPLIALPSRRLVTPAVTLPPALLSLHHPVVDSSCQLVVASPLLVLLLRPAPPSRPLVLSSSRPLVLSSSRPLVLSSSRPLVLSSSRPLREVREGGGGVTRRLQARKIKNR